MLVLAEGGRVIIDLVNVVTKISFQRVQRLILISSGSPIYAEKMMLLWKQHIGEIQAYLKNFLTHQEVRFQQLGISTFCRLQAGACFLPRLPAPISSKEALLSNRDHRFIRVGKDL